MLAFQDSLVMSEVHDWVDLLQPFHESNSEKAISSVDFDSDLESSAMRCSPQVGFSAARRRIKSLTSTVTRGLPTGLDFQRQKRRNALRCQPIKVAGLTIINALRQSNQ